MSRSDLETKVLEEIQLLSEERLAQIYDIIRSFQIPPTQSTNIMRFAGCWNDISNDTYNALTKDLTQC